MARNDSLVYKMEFQPAAKNEYVQKYSRQIGAIGFSSMKKLRQFTVLVIGLNGVGQEVTKCLTLLGVTQMTLVDDSKITLENLQTIFYGSEKEIGEIKSKVAARFFSKMCQCEIQIENEVSIEQLIQTHDITIITQSYPTNKLCSWSKIARESGNKFVVGMTEGLVASIFCDFAKHTITNISGKEPEIFSILFGMVNCTKEFAIDVQTNNDLDFDIGDFVSLSKIAELEPYLEFNDYWSKPLKVIAMDHSYQGCTFEVTGKTLDTRSLSFSSGYLRKIDLPVEVDPVSFEELLEKPNLVSGFVPHIIGEKLWNSTGSHIHIARVGILQFLSQYARLPTLLDFGDAQELISICEQIFSRMERNGDFALEYIDKNLIEKVSFYSSTELPGLCSIVGGLIANEVIKMTGKGKPSLGWCHLDFLELLENSTATVSVKESRYKHQESIFGSHLQDTIEKSKVLLVGAGALGCEYLKHFVQMGFSVSGGEIVVTDMDNIELSNLTRQFLFQECDINKPKSKVAAARVLEMNQNLNIKAETLQLGKVSEKYFNREFWQSLTCSFSALDNIDARRYLDSKCVLYQIPLLDAGIKGMQGNTQIFFPHKTSCYNDIPVAKQEPTPSCTLKLFPYLPMHCIEWSRSKFEEYFVKIVEQLSQPSVKFLSPSTPYTAQDICINLAVAVFIKEFNHSIKDITHAYPIDYSVNDESNAPFWGGCKRFPKPINLSPEPYVVDFLKSTSNIFLQLFSINDIIIEIEEINEFISSSRFGAPSEWIPRSKDLEKSQNSTHLSSLIPVEMISSIQEVSFEKDNDDNFHIDFITNCGNLRAMNYEIPPTTRFDAKILSGKYAIDLNDNTITSMDSPVPVLAIKGFSELLGENVTPVPDGFTCWDTIAIKIAKETTLASFLATFPTLHYNCKIQQLVVGYETIYSSYLPTRFSLDTPLYSIYEKIGQDGDFIFNCECMNEINECVIVPPIVVAFE